MANTYLTKTYTTQPTNGKIGTFSFWIKFSKLSASGDRYIFSTYENSNNRTLCKFNTDGKLELQTTEGANAGLRYDTSRVFRDTNCWYNIIIATDTTQSTAANRVKIYVNGVQETSFTTANDPAINLVPHFLYGGIQKWIGVYGGGGANNWDGLMSHVAYIDGTQELPTIFGETDSTTGEWKIKTTITPSSAWGTNGYWILKDGNTVTDSSSNSNAWTVGGGTLTKTEDNPSNVFNTFNANFQEGGGELSNGNTTYYNASTSNWYTAASNLADSAGKYYCELKITDATYHMVGVGDMQYLVARGTNSLTQIGNLNPGGVGLYSNNGNKYLEGTDTTYAASYGDGDILSIALDMDNDKVYYAKNGDWSTGSGAWGSSTFDSAVGAITLPTTNATYGFVSSQNHGGKAEWNFGNGYFGTTAVSSAGTNASGNGIFEYDTPTGYTALSTKGLNL